MLVNVCICLRLTLFLLSMLYLGTRFSVVFIVSVTVVDCKASL